MAWRDLIQRNLGWKLVSLFLAAGVWVTFTYQADARKRFTLVQSFSLMTPTREFIRHPIKVVADSRESGRFRLDPPEVDITVKGERIALQALAAKEVQAIVDLSNVPENQQVTNNVQIYLPPDVTLVEITPPSVRIERLKP
jgi:YbbR domain-containing protein